MLINFAKPTTKAQRLAIKRLYDRYPIVMMGDGSLDAQHKHPDWTPISYRLFRSKVYQSHMGCLMVQLNGVWIGIEPDGYTHS